MIDFLIDISFKTGIILIPLIFCSIFGWYFLLQSFFFIWEQRKTNKILKQDNFIKALENNNFSKIVKKLEKYESSVYANFIKMLIKNYHSTERHLTIQSRLFIQKNLAKYIQRISSVKFIASLAPLLGLLGTVNGMIATFKIISIYGRSNPILMADGISEALLTTQLGLITAFPLLFIYVLIRNRLMRLQNKMEDILTEINIFKKVETKESN